MKTIIVNIPNKDEDFIVDLLKKLQFKTKVVKENADEEDAIAKWIDAAVESGEVGEETIIKTLKKNGLKI